MSRQASPLRRLKQAWRRSRLARHGITETVRLPITMLGSGGGAWATWLDGVDADSVVYAFGAGTDISFDLDLHARTGAEVHIFDPTPRSIEWVRQQVLPEGVHFHDFGVGAADGTVTFYPPRRESSSHFSPVRRYAGGSVDGEIVAEVRSLRSIMDRLGHARIDVLKIDIEGGEYDVIDSMLADDVPVSQLLVEYHHAYATSPLSRTVASLRALTAAGYSCFNISPRTYEFSLVRNKVTDSGAGSLRR